MGAGLRIAFVVLTATGACQKAPADGAAGSEPFPAPRTPAAIGSAAASAPPRAASPAIAAEIDGGDAVASPVPSSAVSEVTFDGARLTLQAAGDHCSLTFKGGETVHLDLAPPCHVLVWNDPPPRLPNGKSQSGGEPVGRKGEAMAWMYASAGGAKVLAVIGDPVGDPYRADPLFAARREKGYRCAGSLQGVKIRKGGPVVTAKWNQMAAFCVETGIDEKDYWMLAHDK